jgi:hypothetical protein
MPVYYMLLDAGLFHEQIRPALGASWKARSFEPCRALCGALVPAAQTFVARYHLGSEQPLLCQVANGLSFDRHRWKSLAGELLLFAAAEIPDIQTAPETLCCLLAPEHYREGIQARDRFAPIQQAHFGTHELVFGSKLYRPDQAGLNDPGDVQRLADYLSAQQPERWTLTDLGALRDPAEDPDRLDELEFAREWFPVLRDLYGRAAGCGQVVVCENIS